MVLNSETIRKFSERTQLRILAANLHREFLCADAILNQVRNGHPQAAHHIWRSWKLLAQLSSLTSGQSVDSLALDEPSNLAQTLKDLGQLNLKRGTLEDWRSWLEGLLLLGAGGSENTMPAASDMIEPMMEDLSKYVPRALTLTRGPQKFAFLHPGAKIIFFLLFLAAVIGFFFSRTGSWNPVYWLASKYEDFTILESSQDWGSLAINKSVGQGTLSVAGTKYSKGLGTHANSTIRIRMPMNVSSFTGGCGLDDEAGKQGSIRCLVVDSSNRIVFQGPLVQRSDNRLTRFEISVLGGQDLTLVVDDGNDGTVSDHADWVELAASEHSSTNTEPR